MREFKTQEDLRQWRRSNPYPVTIVMDRYNGAYSGAKWLAFERDPGGIPDAIGGGDTSEMDFWDPTYAGKERIDTDETKLIGRGDTPDLALADLIRRLEST